MKHIPLPLLGDQSKDVSPLLLLAAEIISKRTKQQS